MQRFLTLALALGLGATIAAAQAKSGCEGLARGLPAWMTCRTDKQTILLRGGSDWLGQPVVDRIKVTLTDRHPKVKIDRAMAAQWTLIGNDKPNRFTFGPQAGVITKRFNSVIDFGVDDAKDVFSFANTTKEHGPYNHLQRVVVRSFGKDDLIQMVNTGKTYGWNDIRGNTVGDVPVSKLRVEKRSY